MPKKAKTAEIVVEMPVLEETPLVETSPDPIADAFEVTSADIDANAITEISELHEDTPAISREKADRKEFFDLNFRKLDKNLSQREREEWNAIYASYRAGSILTAVVAGVDSIRIGEGVVNCLVIFDYRVKVLIPENEIWANDSSARRDTVLYRFPGAQVDYVVTRVDRVGGVVIASRKRALNIYQQRFDKKPPPLGDVVNCRVLAVSYSKLLVEYSGFELSLPASNVTYGTVIDLREDYATGDIVRAVLKDYKNGKVTLSVKEANPHPFEGADLRHPSGTRRLCRIMGKHAGGLFCELEKGLTCVCVYSCTQKDADFHIGDTVLVVITHFYYEHKLVYGKIMTSW